MVNQYKMGVKVEKEHSDLFKKVNKRCGNCISKEEFYGGIAKAHLKEDGRYYSKLKRARL